MKNESLTLRLTKPVEIHDFNFDIGWEPVLIQQILIGFEAILETSYL